MYAGDISIASNVQYKRGSDIYRTHDLQLFDSLSNMFDHAGHV